MKELLVFVMLAGLFISCKKDDVDSSVATTTGKTPSPPEQLVFGTDLDSLPKDTGGQFEPHLLKSDASPYGYYVYTPSAYSAAGPKFPLLIFLHDESELGDSTQAPDAISKILGDGPPLLISQNLWSPRYPMVVAAPQCHLGWWDPARVRAFIQFVIQTYRVDSTRIYLTGNSMGGFGTFDQMTNYGKNSHLAAAVAISGAGTLDNIQELTNASEVPFWDFHGEQDTVVTAGFDILAHTGMLGLHPLVNPKLTLYPGVGHDAWTETYNGTGVGKGDAAFDPFDADIYSWMLQYRRNAKASN